MGRAFGDDIGMSTFGNESFDGYDFSNGGISMYDQNGMINGMDGGGPMLTGTWFNPQTGDYFEVVDSYFENDDCVVVTNNGRKYNYDTLQDYVQTKESTKILEQRKQEIIAKNKVINSKSNNVSLNQLDEVMTFGKTQTDESKNNFAIPEDELNDIISKPFNYTTASTTIRTDVAVAERPLSYESSNIKDEQIIARALDKAESPEITIDLAYSNYPEKEISMLVDIMNVDINDIATWMYNHYFAKNFKTIIINKIVEKLQNPQTISYKEPVDEVIEEASQVETPVVEVEEKPKKRRKTK